MDGIKQIFGKEMARIFRDKKMLFSTFLLPVLLMFGIMTLVGTLVNSVVDDVESHAPIIYMQNAPDDFVDYLDSIVTKYDNHVINSADEMAKAKDVLKDGNADAIVEFPDDFKSEIDGYVAGTDNPQVKVYYNPSEEYSSAAYSMITGQVLDGYRQHLLGARVGDASELTVFTVNSDNENFEIQDESKASGKAAGMMLPYFITILLFAGAMGIGTDMIAGEKERGTMASLLVSPIKRSAIAFGKVFALMVVSGISATIYVVAMVAFMPNYMGAAGGDVGGNLNMSLNITQIIMLIVLLVAISFLYSSIIVFFSVFAKSVKEASSYVMPAYMVILVTGMITMFISKAPDLKMFLIPLYNTSIALQGILSQSLTGLQFGVTLCETIVIGLILQVLIMKAFNSEKIMSA
ncbi:MAG: ABC transporter permease [Suipraeoptans sp.]